MFALSHNKKKLAAWTSEGALTIFFCEGGAVLSSTTASRDTKSAGETSIIWNSGDQFVRIINSIDGMQIRNVYTCAVITDDYVYIEPNSVFQPTGTGSYANYSKQFPFISKADVSSLLDDNLIEHESPPPEILEPGEIDETFSYYKTDIESGGECEETDGKPNEDEIKPELTIDEEIEHEHLVIGQGLLVLTVTPNCVREKGWVQSNLSVTIVDASENEVAKITTSSEKTENVHYISVSELNDKITFRVNKRSIFSTAHLGSYELRINELFTKNQIGKIKDIDRWEKIKSLDGRETGSEVHIEAQFIPMARLTIDESFTFSEQNIEIRHLYAIILWKRPDGSYDLDDRLARIFNFENHQELLTNFQEWHSQIHNRQIYDNQITKLDKDNRVLATALVIAYMRLVCSRYKTEWESCVVKLRARIDNQLYDVDLCKHLSKIVMDFVINRFGVTGINTKVKSGK